MVLGRRSEICVKAKTIADLNFNRVHKFNLSLLGKQAWRLLTIAISLIQVYKAHYYLSCDLFDASLGFNSIYAWRSVMASISVIKSGCR